MAFPLSRYTDGRIAVARDIDMRSLHGGEVVALMQAIHNRLRLSRTRRSVAPLMHFLYADMALTVARNVDHRIACRRGCAHCCFARVDATAPEVLYAVKGLGSRQRLAAVLPTMPEDQPKSCIMLSDEQCSIYSARPLNCRSAASIDAAACEGSFRSGREQAIPVPATYLAAKAGYAIALAGALRREGLPTLAYEFGDGVKTALATVDGEQRWLAGEDIFAASQHTARDIFAELVPPDLYRAAFT